MAVRLVNPYFQWVSGSSVVYAGAKLSFYTTGTTTPKATYSDANLSIANTNPVVADANGKFGDIFLTTGQYKVVLKDSADVTIWTADPVGDSFEDLTVTGAVAFSGAITPAQITANENNYNPTGLSAAVTLRLSTDASRDITGLSGGSSGRLIIIRNVGSFNLVLKDESASSTAANRFALFEDITLQPDQVTLLEYDDTGSRWMVVASPVSSSFASNVTVTSSDAGATVGPLLTLYRNSASPAASDLLGSIPFDGEDSAGNQETYAEVRAEIVDPTSTSEDGRIVLRSVIAGTLANRAFVGNGMYTAGATGGDKGVDTVNAGTYYKNGTALPQQTQFESAEITLTANSVLSASHGLGGIPNNAIAVLRNKTSEFGFVVGEEIIMTSWGDGTNYHTLMVNGTICVFVLDASISVNRGDSPGTGANITLANWKLVFRAWR